MIKKLTVLLLLLLPVFAFPQDWEADIATARSKSKEEQKPLIIVFSGSDWCGPCIKLEQNIWSSDVFKAEAQSHYILYRADFPKKKKFALPQNIAADNGRLADQYNSNGIFPLVVVLSPEGKKIGTTGFLDITPEAYIEVLRQFTGK